MQSINLIELTAAQRQQAAHAVSWVRVLLLSPGAALRAAPAGGKGLLYHPDLQAFTNPENTEKLLSRMEEVSVMWR